MLLNCGVGEDLRVPWTARRSNQSILKEISPEYSLKGLILKRKLQYFGNLIGRTDSMKNTLMLGEIEGGRRRGWQRMRCLDGITDSMDRIQASSGSWWTGKPGMLQSMGSRRVQHDWVTELNWNELLNTLNSYFQILYYQSQNVDFVIFVEITFLLKILCVLTKF